MQKAPLKYNDAINENLTTDPPNMKSIRSLRSFSTKQYFDNCIKLLILGDSNVGKSSLLIRFSEGKFSPYLMGNAGIDVKTKYIDLQNKRVKLEIWDTAGHERFRAITGQYYKGAMGIILVYDVSERKSFENVGEWMEQIDKETEDGLVAKLLVGNKIDLDRSVTKEEGEQLSEKYKVPFLETSAKDASNVEESFLQVANMILKDEKILLKASENNKNGLSPDEKIGSMQNLKGNQRSKGKCC